ncbi:MAG TPA: DUF3108 domain-containing protein [Steroidobacteraceae bacterium]|nr:DUF3108 domain-containing protein [Steroidobacteraceae bacterium]
MQMPTLAAAALAMLLAAAPSMPLPAEQSEPPGGGPGSGIIRPFSSHYVAEWKDISVGVSDLELVRDTRPGHYMYKWTTSARGIFRLVYSDDIVQQSWFAIVGDHVRPERYLGRQGSASVSFVFDWKSGRVIGTSEGKPIDQPLEPGAQDLNSIQIEVMLDLENNDLPPTFHIIDKDRMKQFLYTREGSARLRTALGMLDTIIVASRHTADDRRVLRMWFAPALGYIPVQAERTHDGNLEFAMRIRSLKR